MKLDRAGWPFVAVALTATLALWLVHPWLSAVGALALVFTLNFFRDPERTAPTADGVLISPADGRVIRADAARVSIFMNVFDVHVCRAPVAGRVTGVAHERGRFLAAMKDDAQEQNERTAIVVQPETGPAVRFVLVAGLIARRIVCRVAPGRAVSRGERIGIIRFGSRVDVDLPLGYAPAVSVKSRVIAGVTVIAQRSGGAT
jgi:phosphatidylserine decarboxylase